MREAVSRALDEPSRLAAAYHEHVTLLETDAESLVQEFFEQCGGVVTAEASAGWRKALAAQEKGAVAVLFVSDVHNHPGAANFEQAAASQSHHRFKDVSKSALETARARLAALRRQLETGARR